MAKAKPKRVAGPKTTQQSFVAPSVRIYTDWTPAKLRYAERAAEAGNLLQAVQVCEWLLTDDRVVATLDARIDALMGLTPTFTPGKGKNADAVAETLEQEDWWEAYPESELKQLLRWGILLGVAPARHTWVERAEHGGRVLPMPEFWHPQTLIWDAQRREWRVSDDKSVPHVVVPGDGEWILHMPSGKSRPWAHGAWRALGRFVLLKYFAIGDWGRHSEKGSLLVGLAPLDASDDQRRELATDLASLGSDSSITLPNGFELKLVEVVANTKAIYQAQIEMADTAIAVFIRGGNLTTEVKDGSRAATESQAKTGDGAKLKADANGLSTTLKKQSLAPYAEFNYGDAALAPWPKWPVDPEEDKSERATMVKTLAEGLTAFDKLGFDIDPEATQEEFGLTFLKGRSREREPEPVPAAPGQPGGDKKPAPGKDKPAKQHVTNAPQMAAADGFTSGQLYADDVVDSGLKHGAKSIKPYLADILAAVEAAEDYESLRAAILELYSETLPPEELRGVIHKALVLAELAGYEAVREDS